MHVGVRLLRTPPVRRLDRTTEAVCCRLAFSDMAAICMAGGHRPPIRHMATRQQGNPVYGVDFSPTASIRSGLFGLNSESIPVLSCPVRFLSCPVRFLFLFSSSFPPVPFLLLLLLLFLLSSPLLLLHLSSYTSLHPSAGRHFAALSTNRVRIRPGPLPTGRATASACAPSQPGLQQARMPAPPECNHSCFPHTFPFPRPR